MVVRDLTFGVFINSTFSNLISDLFDCTPAFAPPSKDFSDHDKATTDRPSLVGTLRLHCIIQNHFEIATSQYALFSRCPHCQHALQFNPFFAGADGYEEVLRSRERKKAE
jgi:hypothetical protein